MVYAGDGDDDDDETNDERQRVSMLGSLWTSEVKWHRARILITVVGDRPGVLKVLSALNGAVCFVTPLRGFVAAWTEWCF